MVYDLGDKIEVYIGELEISDKDKSELYDMLAKVTDDISYFSEKIEKLERLLIDNLVGRIR